MSSKVIEINNVDDYQRFKEEHQRGIIMYSAEWCDACKDIYPLYVRIANRYYKRIGMAHVDVEKCQLSFDRVPVFVSFYEGKELDSIEGADVESLKNLIKEAIQFKPIEGNKSSFSRESTNKSPKQSLKSKRYESVNKRRRNQLHYVK